MFVRLNSNDVLLIHVKGWKKWFNDFRENSTDSIFDGHQSVIVKRAVIGSKGGWKLSPIFFKL